MSKKKQLQTNLKQEKALENLMLMIKQVELAYYLSPKLTKRQIKKLEKSFLKIVK